MTIHPTDPPAYLRAMLAAKRHVLALALVIGPEGCCDYATIAAIARIEAELAWRALCAADVVGSAVVAFPAPVRFPVNPITPRKAA